jgi:ubiquinone/menaquinone biosynthesis C-methylase UbiE
MTGLISQTLVPHTKKIIGLDTSQAMVDIYNQKATNNEVSGKMHALCTDILALPVSEMPQELQNVDVVCCSMAYHHIEDIDQASKVLASLLKKGGYFLVVDLLQSRFH